MRVKIFSIALLVNFMLLSTAALAHWQMSDYQRYTHENFRQNALFQEAINFDAIDFARLHAAILYVTNEERAKQRLSPVSHVPQLEQAAQAHSQRMVQYNFFSHKDPKSGKLRDMQRRARAAGVKNPHVAENIITTFGIQYKPGTIIHTLDGSKGLISYTAGGPAIPAHTYLSLAEFTVDEWMNSPGHRANILSDKALQLGVGAAFYREADFKNVAHFKITQKFQWHQPVVS